MTIIKVLKWQIIIIIIIITLIIIIIIYCVCSWTSYLGLYLICIEYPKRTKPISQLLNMWFHEMGSFSHTEESVLLIVQTDNVKMDLVHFYTASNVKLHYSS